MRLRYFDYRYASAVLNDEAFRVSKDELLQILTQADAPLLSPDLEPGRGGVKRRSRSGGRGQPGSRYLFFPVDQRSLNHQLDGLFEANDWELQPSIVRRDRGAGPDTGLKGDYKKGRLQVEAQFGNMARWYTDVFKFQLSYSLDEIDVAVLVVPSQRFANLIDENVAHFERVARELPWAKMSLTLPIWVIGIEPENYAPVRECYEEAAANYVNSQAAVGRAVTAIPFDTRLIETRDQISGGGGSEIPHTA